MKIAKLGIELRKIGSVNDLYNEVDVVLRRNGIPSGTVGTGIQIQTVAHAIQRMFQPGNHFSICVIRDLEKLVGLHISAERMNVYSSIHCMSWSEMTDEYRQLIMAMILDDFRGVLTDNSATGVEPKH